MKRVIQLFIAVVVGAGLAAIGIRAFSNSNTQRLNSRVTALSASGSSIQSSAFKGRLSAGKIRFIGGRQHQCWQDDAANAATDLSLLTSRYLPTDRLLQKIEDTQYVCGKNSAKNAGEVSEIKKKFKDVVMAGRSTSELNFCEASALHFLIRDVARKSAFNTAACPI